MSNHKHTNATTSHASSWIITYSDMVTLLMACFICIITFSSQESEKFAAKKNSLLEGTGGRGIVGEIEKNRLERASVVWRLRMRQAHGSESGAEMAPMYQNPSANTSAQILRALENAIPGRLSDNFTIHLPRSLLFEKADRLSASGVRLLHVLAVNLHDLPYDLQFQVAQSDDIAQAVKLCGYLATREGYEPARLAVGSRPAVVGEDNSIWLVLARQF
ncbi:MAG TPA: flagellar motor protein MotB [Gemmataceae bacterium]|nr:flagellar motor protein MotB [Gemmataceae bacterium]